MSSSTEVILSLLQEDDYEIKMVAVEKLNYLTETNWFEMTDALHELERLADSEDFPSRKLSALVCSKIYYHLQSVEDSVCYAYMAEDLFDVNEKSLYSDTVAGQCIETYANLLMKEADKSTSEVDYYRKCNTMAPQDLKDIVSRTFLRCLNDDRFDQALGVAFECIDVDMASIVISKYGEDFSQLESVYRRLLCFFDPGTEFFDQVTNKIIERMTEFTAKNYLFLLKLLIKLNDCERIGLLLLNLCSSDDYHTAYQLAFDIQDGLQLSCHTIVQQLTQHNKTITEEDFVVRKRIQDLCGILDGSCPNKLYLQFLISNSRDLSQTILQFTQGRYNEQVSNIAIVVANSFMNYGCTCDYLFRHMKDFMSKFNNWGRFIATGSLGVIHKGNESNAMTVLDNYLPKDTVHNSRYAVSGGLFALGIINIGRGGDVVDYLCKHFTQDQSNIVRHGAALGLDMAAFGSNNEGLIEPLLTPIHSDDIVGEAAAIALGMVLIGTQNEYIISTLQSISEVNEHEKTLRGIAIALPLMMYGKKTEAVPHIENLISQQNPIMRWCGMYCIGLAFCGTGSDWAVSQLLHYTVTDANDDVRRSAAISIGFVLYKYPRLCLKVVCSLMDSYNPHVRYGSAMAMGIAFAGSGDRSAFSELKTLWNDHSSFVRQGAFIATAFVLIQRTGSSDEYQSFTRAVTCSINSKHESVVAKFGALIGLGIAYAASGNVTIKLENDDGHENTKAIVGMFLFQQFWFWFPLSLTLSMAFSPTAVILVNEQFNLPEITLTCDKASSEFQYIPLVIEKKTRQKSRSTKNAQGGIHSRLKRSKLDSTVFGKDSKQRPEKRGVGSLDIVQTVEEKVEEMVKKRDDLYNPARVVPQQSEYINVNADKFVMVKEILQGGNIFMVKEVDSSVGIVNFSLSYESAGTDMIESMDIEPINDPTQLTEDNQ